MENIEFEYPSKEGFTIYSKSGCPNCSKVKHLLKEKNLPFNTVDCDEFIIENKELFLHVIKELSQTDTKQFPIIFHDGIFIGGFHETKEYISKKIFTVDENLDF